MRSEVSRSPRRAARSARPTITLASSGSRTDHFSRVSPSSSSCPPSARSFASSLCLPRSSGAASTAARASAIFAAGTAGVGSDEIVACRTKIFRMSWPGPRRRPMVAERASPKSRGADCARRRAVVGARAFAGGDAGAAIVAAGLGDARGAARALPKPSPMRDPRRPPPMPERPRPPLSFFASSFSKSAFAETSSAPKGSLRSSDLPPAEPSAPERSTRAVTVGRRERGDERALGSGLAGPLRAVIGALDAERLEHRLALENEERGEARRHREAPRERDELGLLRIGRVALAVGDARGRKEPRHERVAGFAGRLHVDRVLRLERIAADLAAEDDVALHRVAGEARRHDRLGARAKRRQRRRSHVAEARGSTTSTSRRVVP